ncbi:hypothetical protein JM84_2827 [Dokdonia sp. Hel_I_63]|uniref:hypothetical protein n=1 Tax=unclassified Dokdonia TaxID=2615033 RepID=UPI00020A7C58|nr:MULTISPECIES: hypothetical protein [unclassified Dokdonia]AEE19912.1 hypothetical protein Krodi_1929 [Dokdonia sp. 4H-3-7-5]TVZ23870.1 hypothetical protein JM84_2827 [Dokdonia sp. Hel_I_63]
MGSKKFLHKITLQEFSKRKFLLGIVLGILTAVIFYYFLQYLFILLRGVHLAFVYNADNTLDTDTRNYIALFFSSISVALGNTISIAFIFSGTDRNSQKRKAGRRIINDQSALTPTAIFWIFKILVLTIGSIIISHSSIIFKEFAYAMALLPIVLFFDQVKSLRRFLKGYTIAKMSIHFAIVSLLEFIIALSNINAYDKQGNLQAITGSFANIPEFKLEIEYSEDIFMDSHQNQIRFKVTEKNDSINFFGWDRFLTYHDVQMSILESKQSHYRYDAVFYIDKTIKWNKLDTLFDKLLFINANNILITITNSETLLETYYKRHIVLSKELYNKWSNSKDYPPPPPPPRFFEEFILDKNVDTLNIASFKNTKTSIEDSIFSYIYEGTQSNTAFVFYINQDISVEEYLEFMIGYKKAIYKLRTDYNNHPQLRDDASAKSKYPMIYKDVLINH